MAYPPTLLLLVAILVLIVKALLGDIALTKLRRDLRRLNQRMALLEGEHPVARRLDSRVIEESGSEPLRRELYTGVRPRFLIGGTCRST